MGLAFFMINGNLVYW